MSLCLGEIFLLLLFYEQMLVHFDIFYWWSQNWFIFFKTKAASVLRVEQRQRWHFNHGPNERSGSRCQGRVHTEGGWGGMVGHKEPLPMGCFTIGQPGCLICKWTTLITPLYTVRGRGRLWRRPCWRTQHSLKNPQPKFWQPQQLMPLWGWKQTWKSAALVLMRGPALHPAKLMWPRWECLWSIIYWQAPAWGSHLLLTTVLTREIDTKWP